MSLLLILIFSWRFYCKTLHYDWSINNFQKNAKILKHKIDLSKIIDILSKNVCRKYVTKKLIQMNSSHRVKCQTVN